MTVRHLTDLESMSHHQREQELMQAIRVQGMSVAAFSAWLRQALDPLQQLAGPALDFDIDAGRARARHFTSREEKQRFDEARELDRALRLALDLRRDEH